MSVSIRVLTAADAELLEQIAPGVFDHDIDPQRSAEFLSDPRHHLAVAIDCDTIVGMASAVHYVHPDKKPELWINEVGVAQSHRNRGLGAQLVQALLNEGRRHGCTEAWVLTDRANAPAMRLYASCSGVEAPRDQVMFVFSLS